jgi:CRISPR-associated protein Csb1
MSVTAEKLVRSCREESFAAGLMIRSKLEPIAGLGAPVKPAVYEGGVYQHDHRWHGSDEARQPTHVIVIDNVPSQANRIEAALRNSREKLGLPELVLDLSAVGDLPPHLPRELSSFMLPHRNADAYLRDSEIDGVPFASTELGRSILLGSASEPDALLNWMPQALLFGFWQSHLGKKGPQTKLARSWVSEIVGFDPATTETTTRGLKGDPMNLSIDEAVSYDDDNLLGWQVGDGKKAGKSKSKDSLSEIGHGQVPVAGAPAGVSFRTIEQQSSVSFAGMRRLSTTPEGRALVVVVGLAGHVLAFGRAMSLRSGCELRPVEPAWSWLGGDGDETVEPLSIDTVSELLAECVDRARASGLELSGWGREPVRLEPGTQLAKVIRSSYPAFEGL